MFKRCIRVSWPSFLGVSHLQELVGHFFGGGVIYFRTKPRANDHIVGELYPIISHYIPLYPIISHYIPLYSIISHYIPLYPIISHYIPYYIYIYPYIVTRSTAHIGPWYEMICFTFEVHAMLIILVEKKYAKIKEALKRVVPLVVKFLMCFSHSSFLIKRVFKPPLLVFLHVINFLNSQKKGEMHTCHLSLVGIPRGSFTHSSSQVPPGVWCGRHHRLSVDKLKD